MAGMLHLVRNDGTPSDLHGFRSYHRGVAVNKGPAERISLGPSGFDSLARLNAVPGCNRGVNTSHRDDRAIPQDAAEGQHC